MKCLFLVLEFEQIQNVLIFWISQIQKNQHQIIHYSPFRKWCLIDMIDVYSLSLLHKHI